LAAQGKHFPEVTVTEGELGAIAQGSPDLPGDKVRLLDRHLGGSCHLLTLSITTVRQIPEAINLGVIG
jgi:hypothetical protein